MRADKLRTGRIAFGVGLTLFMISLAVTGWVRLAPKPVPDFELPTLAGDHVRLSSLHGKVVLLNFWASWCAPCREEIPTLEATYSHYRDRGLVIVGVNVYESADQARAFTDQFDVTFPVGLDANGSVAAEFGVSGLPVSILIDRGGSVVYQHMGSIPADTLETQLSPLLQNQ